LPLAGGDSIYTGPGGNAEIQIGPRAYVRVGESSQLELSDLEPDFVQVKVTAGVASLDLRQLPPGYTLEVDTPNAAYTVERIGYYRFDVDQRSTTLITRRGGSATLTPANGQATRVNAAEEVVISGPDAPALETYAAPELDPWDRWNYSRTDYLVDSISTRYVSPDVYGVDELDHSGSWRTVPDYGPIWIPSGVSAGWAPYSTGHWVFDPIYGWSWVDDAPWGWAPYHYGRWVYVNGFWGWAPGPIVARPVYAPALVAWLGGGVRVGVGVGVGWVALGWGEPLVPWWGPRGYVGVPHWAGWGGPRIVNRTVINTTTVNVTNINVKNITYANTQVNNAVIATNSERFGRGGRDYVRPSQEEVRAWHPAEHGIEVKPTAASLAAGEGRAARPPQEYVGRQVVATRAPRDPGSRLRSVGLQVPERASPAPQLVSPRARGPVTEQKGQRIEGTIEQRGGAQPRSEQRTDTANRPSAVERTPAPISATAPGQQQQAPRTAAVERVRPPPPNYNEWRNQQTSRQPETRAPNAPNTPSVSSAPRAPVSTPAVSVADPRRQTAPGAAQTPGGAERHNLPGEPGMRLRSAQPNVAESPARKAGGAPHDAKGGSAESKKQ